MDEGRLGSRLPDLEFDDVAAAASFQLGTYLALHDHAADALVHFSEHRLFALRTGRTNEPILNLGDIERDYGTTFQEVRSKTSASGPFYPPLDLVESSAG